MNTKIKTYTVYYDHACECVVMDWNGYATSAQFREGTEKMLQELIEHRCSKVLADASDMVLIGREDQKWLEKNFLPRAVARGFNAIALVKPKNYFNAVAVETISRHADQRRLRIRIFDDVEEARVWLAQMDE